MGDIELNISLPLDDEGFFRRECPFCRREFAQEGIDSFMTEAEGKADSDESNQEEPEYFCPYCGQSASKGSWWTQEQLSYINIFTQNIMASLINEHLIRPLQRNFGHQRSGPISISFHGHEMGQQEPWISPEVNDMNVFDLLCCNRKIKVEENTTGRIHCFFCGFPHE